MLHVVGNLCRDATLMLDRFPVPGETLVARESRGGWGGKGLNQAVAAARAGAEVILHAAVGAADMAVILADLRGETWPVFHLEPLARTTDTSTVLVREDGENLIVSAIACARAFDPLGAGHAAGWTQGDTLLMQGNLSCEITAACLREARRLGLRTLINPSPLWDTALDWRLVDCVVLNSGELAHLTDCATPEDGVRRLRDDGVPTVVVTRGAEGALAIAGERRIVVPAPSVAVHDTSGAGDVFCGVLAAHLHRETDLADAMRHAVAAAALAVTRPGALASCPTANELTRLERGEAPGSLS